MKQYIRSKAQKRNSIYDAALCELEDNLASPNTVESEFEAGELSKTINAFLGSLDKNDRVMFIKRYWYSCSVNEIAGIFGKSSHYVSVRLSRIRNKLKKYMAKEDVST